MAAGTRQGLGRYVRKTVPVDIAGFPNHPPLELVDDPFDGARFRDHTPNGNQSPASSSSSSSPVDTISSEISPSVRSSSFWSATENNTGRSSVYSLCEDEFDKEESLKVKELFDKIELMLFDDYDDGPTRIYDECKEWVSVFPHIRIVGKTVVPTQDIGYQLYPGPRAFSPGSVSQPSSMVTSFSSHSSHDLAVRGVSFGLIASPKEASSDGNSLVCDPSASGYMSIEEDDGELIHEDGVLEEYFAIDNGDDEVAMSSTVPWWHVRVPVTPVACVRTNIEQNVFSKLWIEITEILDTVMRQYWEMAKEHADIVRRRLPLPNYSVQPGLHRQVDILPISDEPSSYGGGNQFHVTHGRMSRQSSLISNSGSLMASGSTLQGLLKISTKTIQARDKTALQDMDFPIGGSAAVTRPSSSVLLTGRSIMKTNDRMTSAKPRPNGKPKLAPISIADHAKGSIGDDYHHSTQLNEILRGTRMTTIPERPGTSSLSRTSIAEPLPPIVRELTMERLNNSANNNSNRRTFAQNNLLRTAFGEREKSLTPSSSASRPSTSNVQSRNEAPLMLATSKRSSTTVGFSNSRNSVFNTDQALRSRRLTITGSTVSHGNAAHVADLVIPEAENKVEQVSSYRRINAGPSNIYRHIEGDARRSSNSRFNAVVR